MKKKFKKSPQDEIRLITEPIEIRALEEEGRLPVVSGYAAKFNTESRTLGNGRIEFREVIEPGAFDDVLNDDVRALFNHDPSQILARSKNGEGSLSLSVDEVGLRYEFPVPNTSAGRDLVESIQRGDVDQSSFGFNVASDGQAWEKRQEDGIMIRSIKKIGRLLDVSPVTYPAYDEADVALRSLENFQEELRKNEEPTEDHSVELWQRKMDLIDKSAD